MFKKSHFKRDSKLFKKIETGIKNLEGLKFERNLNRLNIKVCIFRIVKLKHI
jgi:hypothetical protein